jgi:hypothetical protein
MHPANAGAFLVLPRILVQAPAPIANNASAAAIAVHTAAQFNFDNYIQLRANLSVQLVESLTSEIRTAIQDPVIGIIIIYAYMRDTYGDNAAVDFSERRAKLKNTKLGSADVSVFTSFAADFQDTAAQLDEGGQPQSTSSLFDEFREACEGVPVVQAAIHQFTILHPNVAAQLIPALVAYVIPQLRNITSSSAGYAGAAIAPVPQVTSAQFQQLMAANAALTAQIGALSILANNNAAANAAFNSRAGGGGPKPPRGSQSQPVAQKGGAKLYCYSHDTNGIHAGMQCRYMLAHPQQFGPALLAAKGPVVPGYPNGKA